MKNKLINRFAIFLLNLLSKTWRYEIIGKAPESTGIVAFWHGYMLPAWKYFSKYKPYAVVSRSKDGDILSSVLSGWGYSLIRGSSSQGNKEALNEIIGYCRNNLVLMTPDGPRGPIHEFKPGAVVAAQRSSNTLCLCSVEIKWFFEFKKSWDKFKLPLPLSKIRILFHEAISIPENSDRGQVDDIIKSCQVKLLDNKIKENI